ncbi:META domain-containing protein [Pedobacter aquatilis]|uniref:META domain-containing protein n=1 Tax=Pedobacter aquatilis TaxID=351343 RepID=UPI00292F075A|nr:META domain-containing protein [Pedobacter aquatilis]
MKNLIICSVLLCLLSSCLEKLDPEKLKGSKWELTQLVGKTLPASAKATMVFNDSLNVSGKSFCNSYGGKVEINENKVALKNIFGTRMFCQETASEETAYLNALNETDHAKIEGDKLFLLKGEQTLLIFKKVD